MGSQSRLLSLEEISVFSTILHSLLISLRYCTYVHFYSNCDTIHRCQCSFHSIISHYMQNSTKQDENYCNVRWVCRFCYNRVKCVYQRSGRVGCFNWRSFSIDGMYRKSRFLLNFGSFAQSKVSVWNCGFCAGIIVYAFLDHMSFLLLWFQLRSQFWCIWLASSWQNSILPFRCGLSIRNCILIGLFANYICRSNTLSNDFSLYACA